jgi:hypothetical protein
MTDDEAVEMMDDMKRMLSQDEIMDVYNFVDRNNISSPIYTYLDQYKGETGSYGLEENGGFDIEKTKQPVDLSSVDPHTLEQIKKQLLARNGEMPTDEEIRNVVSVMNLEEVQGSEDVMIQEGQLGKAIAKMLFEELLKEEEVDDKTLIDNINKLLDHDLDPISPSEYRESGPKKVFAELLKIIKRVNPNANIENKKLSLQLEFNQTMETIYKAALREYSVFSGIREYFRNNLQMFK